MKKVKLNFEQLKVNSFETAKTNIEKGTVNGFVTDHPRCLPTAYIGCPTEYISCVVECPHLP